MTRDQSWYYIMVCLVNMFTNIHCEPLLIYNSRTNPTQNDMLHSVLPLKSFSQKKAISVQETRHVMSQGAQPSSTSPYDSGYIEVSGEPIDLQKFIWRFDCTRNTAPFRTVITNGICFRSLGWNVSFPNTAGEQQAHWVDCQKSKKKI